MKFKKNDRVWFVAGGWGNATVRAVDSQGNIQVIWDPNSGTNPDITWWPEEDFDFLNNESSKNANPLRGH